MKFLGSSPSSGVPATPSKSTGAVDTLIGRHTEILGDIRFAGGLHLDGRVKGKVLTSSDKSASLSVTETGSIEGDVRVPNIMLNGAITGDVHAGEKITLSAKARVNGNVYYRILEMQAGAQVNGQLVFERNDPAALTHQASGTQPAEAANSDGKAQTRVIDVRDVRFNKSG